MESVLEQVSTPRKSTAPADPSASPSRTPLALIASSALTPLRSAACKLGLSRSDRQRGPGAILEEAQTPDPLPNLPPGAGSPSPERRSSRGDSVRVVVRVRPLSAKESAAGGTAALAVSGQRTAVLSDPARAGDAVVRTYDRVLGPEESQGSLFAAVGEPVVEHCMAGFNSSIFAYGQTGAGKTHSMLGRVARRRDGSLDEGCGIALRVFDRLFQRIREVESDSLRFSVKCSFLEIYNEDISDLLVGWADGKGADRGDEKRTDPRSASPTGSPTGDEAASLDGRASPRDGRPFPPARAASEPGLRSQPSLPRAPSLAPLSIPGASPLPPPSSSTPGACATPSAGNGLQIRDGDARRGVYVQDLSEREVLNADDVLRLLQRGDQNRRAAATRMNERSSRSHAVFTCVVEASERAEGGLAHVRFSKLNLIDLAGSERVARSGARGEALAEARAINRSLAVLGRVMAALVERQRRPGTHVPYRDSRLTFLLQESLGGNAKTCILACVAPGARDAPETLSTLAFAAGAKKIRTRAVVNEGTEGDARALQALNAKLAREVEELREFRSRCEREGPREGGEKDREALWEAQCARLGRELEAARAAAAEEAERNAALETVFDQNNDLLNRLRAETDLQRAELRDARAQSARAGADAALARADCGALSGRAAQAEERALAAEQAAADGRARAARAAREAEAARGALEERVRALEKAREEAGAALERAGEEGAAAVAAALEEAERRRAGELEAAVARERRALAEQERLGGGGGSSRGSWPERGRQRGS